MAKKGNQEEKKGGAVLGMIVVFLIIVLSIAILAIMIRLDVGGLGTMLRPTLRNVPILGKILPDVSQEMKELENDYPYTSIPQAIARIEELEALVAVLSEGSSTYVDTISELQAEVARLKVFEDNVLEFEQRVEEFDYKVVFNSKAPDLAEYEAFYRLINPTTAEDIYRLVVEKLQFDEATKEQAKILKAMKPAEAAKTLEEMTADIEYNCTLLLCLKDTEIAAIMDKMNALYRAKLLTKMKDMNEERLGSINEELQRYQ